MRTYSIYCQAHPFAFVDGCADCDREKVAMNAKREEARRDAQVQGGQGE